jgi:hypothetical protein
MPKYLFNLESMHVDFQRGKLEDVYSSTFGIEVGSRAIGPIGRVIGSQHNRIKSGDDIDFSQYLPDNPPSQSGTWAIGPVQVDSGEIVAIDYVFVNTSDSGGLSQGDQTKIGFASWGAIVSVGFAVGVATGPPGAVVTAAAAVAVAVVAGLAAVLGEVFGDITDANTPKCNGVAFTDKIILTEEDLQNGTSNPNGRMIITRNSTNPDIPADCGHASSADITTSVTLVTAESVRRFLGNRGDLAQGIVKGLKLPLGRAISVRSLIEQ